MHKTSNVTLGPFPKMNARGFLISLSGMVQPFRSGLFHHRFGSLRGEVGGRTDEEGAILGGVPGAYSPPRIG
jgi:hypothetical protein